LSASFFHEHQAGEKRSKKAVLKIDDFQKRIAGLDKLCTFALIVLLKIKKENEYQQMCGQSV
jgi:hypothetical protein